LELDISSDPDTKKAIEDFYEDIHGVISAQHNTSAIYTDPDKSREFFRFHTTIDPRLMEAEREYFWFKSPSTELDAIDIATNKCEQKHPEQTCKNIKWKYSNFTNELRQILKKEMQNRWIDLSDVIDDKIEEKIRDKFWDMDEEKGLFDDEIPYLQHYADEYPDTYNLLLDEYNLSSLPRIDLFTRVMDENCTRPDDSFDIACYMKLREYIDEFADTISKYDGDKLRNRVFMNQLSEVLIPPIQYKDVEVNSNTAKNVARGYNTFLRIMDERDLQNLDNSFGVVCKDILLQSKCKSLMEQLTHLDIRANLLNIDEDMVRKDMFGKWKGTESLLERIRNNSEITLDDIENTNILIADEAKIEEACRNNPDSEICTEMEHYFENQKFLKPKKICHDIFGCDEYYYEKCHDITESETFRDDGVKMCARVDVDRINKIAHTSIVLHNKNNDEGTVGCIHVAVMELDNPEECVDVDRFVEHARTTENRPVSFDVLRPIERLYALNSTIEGWIDVGIENMFTVSYEGARPEDLPFGFNALMHSQMLAAITEVSPDSSQRIMQNILLHYAETEPEWLKTHLPAVMERYKTGLDYFRYLADEDPIFKKKIESVVGDVYKIQ